MTQSKRASVMSVASWLCFVYAAVFFISIILYANEPSTLLVAFIMVALFFYAGILLQGSRKMGGKLGIALATTFSALSVISTLWDLENNMADTVSIATAIAMLAMGIILIVLVIIGWNKLH